jgi:hypothetical protein
MSLISRASFLVALCLSASVATAHAGHTDWGAWQFDWEVKDGAGLGLRNVRYKGEYVVYKASMPVIRVRYNGDECGPYADRITWESLVSIGGRCGGRKVCQYAYTSGGTDWLELAVYSRIGAYHLYQAYYFSADGWLMTRLFSKGLQCNVDHQHHPYWRFDFDVNGAGGDQVFVYDNNRPNEGWGSGWHKYTNETDDRKNPSTARVWFVRDGATGHGVWVLPGGDDGNSDNFSRLDVGARLYRYNQDEPWPFGAWGELGYGQQADIQEKDDVLWYVAHLGHSAAGGADHWHSVGANLRIFR